MAITTYAELKTSVANWLARSDLTDIIPDLITLGEKRIFREVRCREMESTLSGTISGGVLALPADYIALKHARITSSVDSPLKRASADQVYTKYPLRASTGMPVMIARDGDNFIFGPYPDSDYTVAGTYYAQLATIDTSTNALFLANPDVYLWASLCEAAPYIQNDARLPVWETKYGQTVAMINGQDADEFTSGTGLAMVAA